MDPTVEGQGDSYDATAEPVPDTPAVTGLPYILSRTRPWRGLFLSVLAILGVALAISVYVHALPGVYAHSLGHLHDVYVHSLGALRRVYVHA